MNASQKVTVLPDPEAEKPVQHVTDPVQVLGAIEVLRDRAGATMKEDEFDALPITGWDSWTLRCQVAKHRSDSWLIMRAGALEQLELRCRYELLVGRWRRTLVGSVTTAVLFGLMIGMML